MRTNEEMNTIFNDISVVMDIFIDCLPMFVARNFVAW